MPRALASAFLIAALATAQQPAPPATRVEGRVLTAGGDPVPRATVRLRGGPLTPDRAANLIGYVATADDEGNFMLEGMPPGDYTFTAEKTGFVNQGYQAQTPGTTGAPFRLAAGQSVKGVEFRLSANAIVSGIVTTPEGDPVPGKQVTLLMYHYWTRGVRQWFGRDRATTDDRGQFRIAGVAPGQYLLSVSAPDFDVPDPQAPTLKEALVNTYFPGVSDIKAATPITLTPAWR